MGVGLKMHHNSDTQTAKGKLHIILQIKCLYFSSNLEMLVMLSLLFLLLLLVVVVVYLQ